MHQLCVMHNVILCASPQCHSAQHIALRYMPSRKTTLRMALSRKGRGCEDKYIIARYAAHKVSSLRLRRSSPLRTAPKKTIEWLSSFFVSICEGNIVHDKLVLAIISQ